MKQETTVKYLNAYQNNLIATSKSKSKPRPNPNPAAVSRQRTSAVGVGVKMPGDSWSGPGGNWWAAPGHTAHRLFYTQKS